MRFRFIHAEKENYSVRLMCRVLRVSAGGYYAHLHRTPNRRRCEDERLMLRIQAVQAHS
jgi:putative transposase